MSVNQKMTAIANAVRAKTGSMAKLTLDGMAQAVNEVFEKGKAEGLTEAAEICTHRHYVHTCMGDGTGLISFFVPFAPDALFIIGMHPSFNRGQKLAVGLFSTDLRAFGYVAGSCTYTDASGTLKTVTYSTASVYNRYARTEDGTVTVQNLVSSVPVVFDSTYPYTVVAVQYTDKTDRERITEYVNGLTGSGTATLSQGKVNAAFTAEEWSALIAAKPNWTFTLI